AMRRKLAELKADLAGPSPSQVEKLLVDRIGGCWLHVFHLEMEATHGLGSTNTPQAGYAQRRLGSANRRYLSSLRQLATVSRLLGLGQSPNEASPAPTPRSSSRRGKQPAGNVAAPAQAVKPSSQSNVNPRKDNSNEERQSVSSA